MQRIKFIKRYLVDYCSITASFISYYNKDRFDIVDEVNPGDTIGLTYLPHYIKISKNKSGESASEYYNRIREKNKGIDLLSLIAHREQRMKIEKYESITLI